MGLLSRPVRILILSTVGFAALFLGYLAYHQAHEPYGILFSQLDQEDAAAIVAKLKEQKTPYLIEANGSTIEVPESRVAEARLDLASAGMPRGGGVGFESFDKMRLGATEFEQHVLYRRALEGELARTISTISSVQSARVHLVLPEKSVFVSRSDPASSSIVLKLRSGRTLGGSEVSGIVHLVAASVPGLTPDRIALVTTEGEMLKKPRAEGASAEGSEEEQGAVQRTLESQLEDRTKTMLEKVVGMGHVDVRVTAEIDSASVEHTEDHYDPSKSVLRSEETSMERSGPALDESVAGVPGAESNLPAGAALPAAALGAAAAAAKAGDAGAPKPLAVAIAPKASDPVRESHTRNYEVDHVSDKRILRPGTVKRITAAVVFDGVTRTVDGVKTIVPRDKLELDRLAALVRSAVGANDARGDVVTVDSVPFQDAVAALDTPVLPPTSPSMPILSFNKPWRSYLPLAGGTALLLFGTASVLAVGRRRRKTRTAALAKLALPSASADEIQIEPTTSPEALRAAAFERAAKDPATAALVVRFWLGTRDAQSGKPLAP